MFLNKKRMNNNFNNFNNQQPSDINNINNPYLSNSPDTLSMLENEINELKRQIMELTRRLNSIENYLGMRRESEASNYNN